MAMKPSPSTLWPTPSAASAAVTKRRPEPGSHNYTPPRETPPPCGRPPAPRGAAPPRGAGPRGPHTTATGAAPPPGRARRPLRRGGAPAAGGGAPPWVVKKARPGTTPPLGTAALAALGVGHKV